jgi:hypothetical protein
MNARFYWFTFDIGFGLFVVGMHALLHGFEWNDSLRRFCLGVMMAFGLLAYLLGQYVGYPKPNGLYRIADAVGFGCVFSLLPVALSSEVEWSQRFMTFTTFFGIGLLLTPRGFQNATKYEWWHGFNPDKIIDQVEPHAHWHIIMMISAAFLLQIAGIDAQLLWSVMLPALINPPKVQQYAEEMEGYWRELLLLFPCIFVFGYLEITMH